MKGIYKLHWDTSPFFYIGKAMDIDGRFRTHLSTLRRGTHHSKLLQSAFNEHGQPSITVIEQCNNRQQVDAREWFHIGKFTDNPFCCNNNGRNIFKSCPLKIPTKLYTKLSNQAHKQGHKSVKDYILTVLIDL